MTTGVAGRRRGIPHRAGLPDYGGGTGPPLSGAVFLSRDARGRGRAPPPCANLADFQARVTRGEEIPYVLRIRCRYDAAHALAHCLGAVYRLLEVNGGRTMQANELFQRSFRDLLAMRNHISATLEGNASAYALAKLGAPPPPFNRAQRMVI
jgi:hypothetical protein